MLGPLEYAAIGLIGVSVAFGGVQTVRMQAAQLKAAELENREAVARGELHNCAARLKNIQEAMESNARIPDDLGGFVVPPGWLLPDAAGSPAD